MWKGIVIFLTDTKIDSFELFSPLTCNPHIVNNDSSSKKLDRLPLKCVKSCRLKLHKCYIWHELCPYNFISLRTSAGSSRDNTVLNQIFVPVLEKSTCLDTRLRDSLTDNMFCAGHLEGGKDTCQVWPIKPVKRDNRRLLSIKRPNEKNIVKMSTLINEISW